MSNVAFNQTIQVDLSTAMAFSTQQLNGFNQGIDSLNASLTKSRALYKKHKNTKNKVWLLKLKNTTKRALQMLVANTKERDAVQSNINFMNAVINRSRDDAMLAIEECKTTENDLLNVIMDGYIEDFTTSSMLDNNRRVTRSTGSSEILRHQGNSMLNNYNTRKEIIEDCDEMNYWI